MTASFSSDAPELSTLSFSGRRSEFLKMLATGSLYQIPTFGFYRFWLTTKIRRHLWANTQVAGEPFEYTGTAKELLIGFLIALAVLAPLYAAIFALSFVLEERQAFASIPLFLVLYVLAHFGRYRARRYRASRTIFRGVRFWMDGAGWDYAFLAIRWDWINLLTLGLSLPWAMASLERYRMRHTYFGDVRGDFTGTGWGLFKRAWWIVALGLIIIGGSIGLGLHMRQAEPDHAEAAVTMATFVALIPLALLMPLAMAIVTRWHIDGLRFGRVVVSNRLRIGTFYGLFLKMLFSSLGYAVAFLIVSGIGSFVAGLFFKEALADMQAGEWSAGAIVIGMVAAVAYLLFLLGFGVIQRYFLGRGLWAAIVATTTVSDLHALDRAVAAGRPSGVLGEGLADALDFNVGL